jgi:inner membrane protein
MAPQQHLVLSWVLSNLNYDKRRDRIVATICGVIPDVDGLGIVIDKILGDGSYYYYFLWHRKGLHGAVGLLAVGIAAYLICRRKLLPTLVAALTYTTHILFDLVGSAGPDGGIWPMYPLWPFSKYEMTVSWQWSLNDWKNTVIAGVFILIMIIIAAKKNRTCLEVVSPRLDRYCIETVRRLVKREHT